MEERVFRLPAVAGILESRFVEARLHTDGESNIDRILALQKELAGSPATPVYLVVDPDSGEILTKLEGPRGTDLFVEFLNDGLEASKRPVRVGLLETE